MTFEVRMDVSVEPSDVTSFGLWVGQDDSHFLRFEIYRANGHAFVKAFSVFWPAGAEELSYGIGSTMAPPTTCASTSTRGPTSFSSASMGSSGTTSALFSCRS